MKIKTLQDVIDEVESIKGLTKEHDDAQAHIDSDYLYELVLKEVASGNPEARAMAKEALKTLDIDFCRMYE